MSLSERDQYLMDQYLRDALSSEEALAFEARLDDPVFAEALKFHQDVQQSLKISKRKKHKSVIKDFELIQQSKDNFGARWPYWTAAAAIIILIVSTLWTSSKLTPEEIFTIYYTHFPDAVSEVTRADAQPESRDSLMLAYNQQHWREARSIFSAHVEARPDDLEIKLYHGLSQLMDGDPQKAAFTLGVVIENISDDDYRAAAQWYRALALIRAQLFEEAKHALRTIAQSTHYKSIEAKNILAQLP